MWLWVPESLESLVCLCTPLAPDQVKWNSRAEYVASTALLKCRSELILKSQLVHHQCCLCTSLCWSVDLGKAPEHTQGQQPNHAQFPTENEAPWVCQDGLDPEEAPCATDSPSSSTDILLSVILKDREGGHSWAVSQQRGWTMCTAPVPPC